MGLWLKQDDGSIVEVSGGVGGGGGPHDHAEYALVEHEHDDHLPLTGGTVTGDLTVDGLTTTTGLNAKANGSASATNPNITFGTSGVNAQTGFYRNSTGAIQVACEGEQVTRFTKATAIVYNDLQVDGKITVRTGGGAGSGNVAIGFDGIDGMGIYSSASGSGYMRFGVAGTQQFAIKETETVVNNDLRVDGTINGTLAFGVAEGIDTGDVLEQAETATMPAPVDEEGAATADIEAEIITVNEVMTALLAKVKELSARIEELEGA